MTSKGALLGAEFGSVWTRVLLLDVVDNEYRIVARTEGLTTLGAPVNDVLIGLRRLLRDMTASGVRQLLDEHGQLITPERDDRSGVDAFLATTSAGRALRALLVGLLPQTSLRAARLALSRTSVDIVEQIHLLDGRDEEARLNALILSRPDLVLIVGGTEGGAQERLAKLVKDVQFAVALMDRTQRPVIVYGGNQALAQEVQERFEGLCECILTPNLLPAVGTMSLDGAQKAIASAYDAFFKRRDARFSTLGRLSAVGLRLSAESYGLLAEYWHRAYRQDVALVDLGSASALIAYATNAGLQLRMDARLGQGHSADTALESVGEDALAAWLPFHPQAQEIRHYALNKTLRPATIPMSARELYLEHALARANLRYLLNESRLGPAQGFAPQRILVCGATLTRSGDAFHNLLLLADCLQPLGLAEVYADSYGAAAILGAVAQTNSAAFAQISETAFTRLGVLISLNGSLSPERRAARLLIKTEGGERLKAEIKGGHLLSLPLPAGTRLEITLTTSRGVQVGGKSRLRLSLEGGEGGILIDARGRAFQPAQDVATRAENLATWYHEATDQAKPEIPPDWLIMSIAQDEVATLDDEAMMDDLRGGEPRRRRRLFASAQPPAAKPPKGRDEGRKRGRQTGEYSKTVILSETAEGELDDEFAALIGDAPAKPEKPKGRGRREAKPAKDAQKSTTGQLNDDMDLRDLL